MDMAQAALYPVAAMENAENQSRRDDRTRDRKGGGIYLGLQWPGAVVERRSVSYERCGNCQMATATGAHEPTCGTSTFYQTCMNCRMPNGTYRV